MRMTAAAMAAMAPSLAQRVTPPSLVKATVAWALLVRMLESELAEEPGAGVGQACTCTRTHMHMRKRKHKRKHMHKRKRMRKRKHMHTRT